MLGQFIIVLREGFEAAIIVSIVLAYLSRTGKRKLRAHVWWGVYGALAVSLLLGASLWTIYGAFGKGVKPLFEGASAWLAMFVLSWAVYWMASKGRVVAEEVERKARESMVKGDVAGFTFLAFVAVFREGLESILFLMPFAVRELLPTLAGASAGALASTLLAYGVFSAGMRMNMGKFFRLTGILLLILASGLASYGAHEFIEYAEHVGVELGWLAEKAYTLPLSPRNLLHHENVVGSILSVLTGYVVEAEWGRVAAQLLYLTVAIPLFLRLRGEKGGGV